KGERCQHLELSGLAKLGGDGVEDRLQVLESRDEVVRADRLPVDLDPLRVRDQVRLRHESDAVALRLQDGREADTGRLLAVGAGDQRSFESSIRCAEAIKDRASPFSAELHSESA